MKAIASFFLALFYFFLITQNANAQTEKGNFTFGSNLFASGIWQKNHTVQKVDSLTRIFNMESPGGWGFNFWLNGSYFIKNNLSLGIELGKQRPDAIELSLKPFIRYYLNKNISLNDYQKKKFSQKIIPFFETNIDFGLSGNKYSKDAWYKENTNKIGASLGGGICIFISKHLAIENLILFQYTRTDLKQIAKNKGLPLLPYERMERTNYLMGITYYAGINYYF
jgi:hypothetical protein